MARKSFIRFNLICMFMYKYIRHSLYLLTYRLKKREDFWIQKLKTDEFNAELNFPNPQYFCISCPSISLKVTCRKDKKHKRHS